jgi:Zn-dependent protease with chaperone function
MKKRLFDKDVEIAKLNTAVAVAQSDYLATLAVAVTLLIAFATIAVQLMIELVRAFNYALLSMFVVFFMGVLAFGGAIRHISHKYVTDLKERTESLDDIANAGFAGSKWIIYESEDQYKYMIADGRIIDHFDEQGSPIYEEEGHMPDSSQNRGSQKLN